MIIYLFILWMFVFFWATKSYDVFVRELKHMTLWTVLSISLLTFSILFSIMAVKYGLS